MTSTIRIKRSSVPGKAPNTTNISTGELALNITDGIMYSTNGSVVFEIGSNLSSLNVTNDFTVDTNTLHVDSVNNRVGIGTANPAYQFEIENTGSNALLVLDRTDGAACFIEGQATRSAFGSVGATPLVLAYNSAAVVEIGASGAITVNPDGASPYTFPTTDGSANQFLQTDGAGNISFTTVAGGGSTTVSATAPVSPNEGDLWWDEEVGSLFIYYTDANTNQWVAASSSGNPFSYSSNTNTYLLPGNLTVIGDINSTSDITLKDNIQTFSNALEVTNQMRGVSFDWKESGKPSIGLIAQEVNEVLPELVGQVDGKMTLQYSNIVAVLIEAVKELTARVQELENR